jgi:hypothetical protein
MYVSLRIKRMSHQPEFAIVNGDTRLIAGSFNTQYAQNSNPEKARYQIYTPSLRSAMLVPSKKQKKPSLDSP